MVLVELIRLIPISIQGIGVREGMFAYFCGKLGISPEAGFILGTVSYLALSLSIVIAGFFGLCLMHLYPLDKEGYSEINGCWSWFPHLNRINERNNP